MAGTGYFYAYFERRREMKGYFKKGACVVGVDISKGKSRTIVTTVKPAHGVIYIEKIFHGESIRQASNKKLVI